MNGDLDSDLIQTIKERDFYKAIIKHLIKDK